MLSLFFFVSLCGCVLSYANINPMKSSLFLVLSVLFLTPLVSFGSSIWFSYFICLLFLSGVFVIIIYFSSLSKMGGASSFSPLILFFLTCLVFSPFLSLGQGGLSVNNFYFSIYWVLLFWLIFILLGYMNFISYYLSFSGALRKV
uniref:NADH dehydrogenase subunit 6 n=1 Tax=Rhigonema thysanophora TaxID=435730 RepID=X2CUE0_9BILA|nr:NADH dehydrogenase subunit 6 [Rhigonema thysanophora]AGZ90413.1 NADH dehydrogenase subunit 6 [Rhigonema thysanophora]